MDEIRSKGVAVALREELSDLIAFELADPRLQGVQVTDVHVSPDRFQDLLLKRATRQPPEKRIGCTHG